MKQVQKNIRRSFARRIDHDVDLVGQIKFQNVTWELFQARGHCYTCVLDTATLVLVGSPSHGGDVAVMCLA